VNISATDTLERCTMLRQEMRQRNGADIKCIVFTHPSIGNGEQELWAAKRYVHTSKEGLPDKFFEDLPVAPTAPEPEAEALPEAVVDAVGRANRGETLTDDIIQSIINQGVLVDDDNQPLPENRPSADAAETPSIMSDTWGHSGICPRKAPPISGQKERAKMLKSKFDSPFDRTLLEFFEAFFPVEFVEDVILPATNDNLKMQLTYGEFLRWIGLWFLIATTSGHNRHDFWSINEIDRFSGAPFWLNDLMSRDRFDDILKALTYNSSKPVYKDKFWEVRPMLEAWNDNMAEQFQPSWISCLDESMSKWMNQFTCPGYIFCPRKPWPFGNEYHTIACGESRICWRTEIVEGKDCPPEKSKKAFHDAGGRNKGQTVSLMMRMTEPIHNTGKCVVLNSGFCVLQGIMCLLSVGVFAAALIKKRRYWPKFIPGDRIKAHFDELDVGSVDALEGELDGRKFHVFAMKEPDYVMMLMLTYGTCNRVGEEKRRDLDGGVRKVFRYPEVVYNHYQYRDAIDSNNAWRMGPIALEEVFATQQWPNRVFAYLLATSAVNANLGYCYFWKAKEVTDELTARKELANQLIFNPYLEPKKRKADEMSARLRPRLIEHRVETLPPYKKFDAAGRIVTAKKRYADKKCFCKGQSSRKYCTCSPGIMRCMICYADHYADAVITDRDIRGSAIVDDP